jgi:alkanesulfonate monooxygenase SsuD/methylene tetrahydromethanopterin reductase-like flavin-dependent oxidoreductase (luciferase family)
MRFGLDVPVDGPYADPRLLARMGGEAERGGWDGFFVQDVLSMPDPIADPWVALTAVVLATERMAVGSMLTPLPRRRPWEVARQTVTLDRLSGGRLIFAAGLGYAEHDFTPFGDDWDAKVRAAQLDEALDVIAGLWSAEPFSYAGDHYRLDQALLRPGPGQTPRIPVWLAAGWPRRRPLRRAARWDGVYLMTVQQDTEEWLGPDDVAGAARFLRQQRGDGSTGEIAINAQRGEDPAITRDRVQSFAGAGATWWLELAPDGGPDAYLDRIRRGPPRT